MMSRLALFSTLLVGLAIAAATLVPIGLRPHLADSADAERALAFFLLGICAAVSVRTALHWVLLTGIVYAGALEWLQEFVPTRHAELHDAGLKAVAFAAGVVLVWIGRRLSERGATPARSQ
ncbi:VanZ family protein [Ancylobacter sp. 6x-1]|uniref:VanZ family protein n=1 Tax=Ancylobacter crimeensis TaxID=2579147 RepID=A0ABT0DCN1_9HYPH|nr:VanZ family protein [Ancylobacter crimeensis]MCK0197727.1 VanZ family protein [Ancylobacter crimeensis]